MTVTGPAWSHQNSEGLFAYYAIISDKHVPFSVEDTLRFPLARCRAKEGDDHEWRDATIIALRPESGDSLDYDEQCLRCGLLRRWDS